MQGNYTTKSDKTAFQDRVVSVVLLALITAGYVVTFKFDKVALYPRLLLGVMAILALAIAARTFLPMRFSESGSDEVKLGFAQLVQPTALALLVVAYVWAIPVLGYFFSTLIALPAFVFFMGTRGWLAPVLCAIGFAGFVYLLFRLQLRVPLPVGLMF